MSVIEGINVQKIVDPKIAGVNNYVIEVQRQTVKKTIEPKILGRHEGEAVYLCYGPYGEYLRYKNSNYSIPEWGKQANLEEMFNLYHAVKIIDYKMKNKKQIEVKVPDYKPKKHTFHDD